MASTMISIRMDKDLKKEMELTCRELGLTMSAAFTIFAKKMCREKRIPFEVSYDPFYSKENLSVVAESLEQYEEGKTLTKSVEEPEDLFDE